MSSGVGETPWLTLIPPLGSVFVSPLGGRYGIVFFALFVVTKGEMFGGSSPSLI